MPPSISHEGYSDKAAYSYWDDFWAYAGYRSAVELAAGLGLEGDASRLAAQRDEFLADLQGIACGQHRPLRPRRAARGRGPRRLRPDLEHGRAEPRRPAPCAAPPAGARTFERYWRNFQTRRSDEAARRSPWRRRLHALRMAQRRRVRSPGRAASGPCEAMAYFHADRRPQRMEPVGRGRGARCPRAALSRRHAARLGRFRPDPLRARSLRLRGRGRVVPRAGGRRAHGLAGAARDSRFAIFGRPGDGCPGAHASAPAAPSTSVCPGLRSFPRGGVTLRGPWGKNARVTIDGRITDVPADAISSRACRLTFGSNRDEH